MQAYISRRLLAMVPTLLFASLIVFTTVRLTPDNIIDLMLSSNDIGADKKNSQPVLQAARRHPVRGQPRQVAVAEHLGDVGGAASPAHHFRARHHSTDRSAVGRHPDRSLFSRCPGHAKRLPHALLRHPGAGAARLLGRHAGDGVPVDLVGLVAGGEVHPLHPGCAQEPRPDDDPGTDPRHGVLRRRHAAHAYDDAGGHAAGLHPHRRRQGGWRTTRLSCAMRCATR